MAVPLPNATVYIGRRGSRLGFKKQAIVAITDLGVHLVSPRVSRSSEVTTVVLQ